MNNDGGLPAGYIPCETIGSDGYSAFIDSQVLPLPTMSFELYVRYIIIGAIDQYPIGCHEADWTRFYFAAKSAYNYIETGYRSYYQNTSMSFTYGNLYHIKGIITPNGTTYEIERDGVPLSTIQSLYTEPALSINETFALLGRKNGGTGGINSGEFRGNLGRVILWSDDHFGAKYADFIPCFDGVNFGYYDLVARRFLQGSTPNKIIGFGEYWNTQGFINNTYHNLIDDRGYVESPLYIKPEGCTSIRFNCSHIDSNARILYYDSSLRHFDYFSYNTEDRVVSAPSSLKYMRLVIPKSNFLDYTAYIYDETNKQYIWMAINAHIPE